MTLEDLTNPDGFKLPFCMVYEPTLILSVIDVKKINPTTLTGIRSKFIDNYYSSEHNKKYPNMLFDYQKKILEAGHFEAYNHWIMMKGDPEDYDAWLDNNQDKMDRFVDWFMENPIPVSKTNHFFRNQY